MNGPIDRSRLIVLPHFHPVFIAAPAAAMQDIVSAEGIGIIQYFLIPRRHKISVFLCGKPEFLRILHTIIDPIAARLVDQPADKRLGIFCNLGASIPHCFRILADAFHHPIPADLQPEIGKRAEYVIENAAFSSNGRPDCLGPLHLFSDKGMPLSQRLHPIQFGCVLHAGKHLVGISEISVAHDFDKILPCGMIIVQMCVYARLPLGLFLRKMVPKPNRNPIHLPMLQRRQHSFCLVHLYSFLPDLAGIQIKFSPLFRRSAASCPVSPHPWNACLPFPESPDWQCFVPHPRLRSRLYPAHGCFLRPAGSTVPLP